MLMNFFGFEAEFSTALARKNARNGDVYYLAGHIFRAISAMNQALFARNRRYCLNEKKAIFRIDTFEAHPENCARRVNAISFPAWISTPLPGYANSANRFSASDECSAARPPSHVK